MINIINPSHNPYFNMAVEEYFLKYSPLADDLLMLWQNSPTVVVGRYQNTLEEIHYDYLQSQQIAVVRRLTGGGAVYHDQGNLNFTYIMNHCPKAEFDFAAFAVPVIKALAGLGIQAEATGRNDITIDGKKFSGNSEYFFRNRLLHHGTLLFNADFSMLTKVLQVKEKKYLSKGVKSVAGRVTNIADHLQEPLTIEQFQKRLVQNFFDSIHEPYREYRLTSDDLSKIEKLQETRYSTWDWNFGASPKCSFRQEKTFRGGTVSLHLEIVQGKISICKIYGDFFGNGDISDLENLLVGTNYEPTQLKERLGSLPLDQYFFHISPAEFFSCFF